MKPTREFITECILTPTDYSYLMAQDSMYDAQLAMQQGDSLLTALLVSIAAFSLMVVMTRFVPYFARPSSKLRFAPPVFLAIIFGLLGYILYFATIVKPELRAVIKDAEVYASTHSESDPVIMYKCSRNKDADEVGSKVVVVENKGILKSAVTLRLADH